MGADSIAGHSWIGAGFAAHPLAEIAVKFTSPWWLAAGLCCGVLLVLMWRAANARQHAALAKFVSAHLRSQLTRSISVGKRRVQRGLFWTALICLFAALAGPLIGYRWEQVSRRGNEIMFAIDTSRSMLTPDVKPNRLTRAKLAIDDFAKQLDGDAVGIVAFAGTAFLACPMTLDYGAFHESLGAIDTNTIPRGGTNISSAIHAAQAALHRRPGGDRILILVTDGEDLEGDALAAARTAAQADGLKIYSVGVGTAAGDLIPVAQDMGGGFVKDDSGAFVRSRLDEPALKAIAAASGGSYAPLGTQGEGLDAVFKTIFGSVQKHDLAYRQQKIYIQRYQWPLAASLGLLLASLLIGNRRSGSASRSHAGMALIGLMFMAAWPIHPMRAASVNSSGANPSVPPTPGDPKNPVQEFNTGTAAYRAGRFPQAAQAFQQSIAHAPSSDLKRLADQQDAYYDLGNTLYRAGQKTEHSASQETLQKWTDAVKAYETALQLRADDADSKFNRDLVKRKIDALKQQQNPDQNQNQNQNQSPNPQNKGGGQGQGQPPNTQQNSKNNDPQPGQPPPQPQAAGSKEGQPPPGAGQPPSAANEPQPGDDAAATADDQHPPGQMSREEARELLDSAKGDERRALGAPVARREASDPPDKPFKNW
jgi:Ca-activated chloride channel family protein